MSKGTGYGSSGSNQNSGAPTTPNTSKGSGTNNQGGGYGNKK